MSPINHLSLNSSRSVTDLCRLGTLYGTDKSPYFKPYDGAHRHAYTAIYDLMFSAIKYNYIVIGEVGILYNKSMFMWRYFFPNAKIYGFEYFKELIEKAESDALPRCFYGIADVGTIENLSSSFRRTGEIFDILIDDSTHQFDHQINFVAAAIDFVRPGGTIVIEDIFRGWPEDRYRQALEPYLPYFFSVTFVDAVHDQSYSEGTQEPLYNNDKLLVLRRNDRLRVKHASDQQRNLAMLPT